MVSAGTSKSTMQPAAMTLLAPIRPGPRMVARLAPPAPGFDDDVAPRARQGVQPVEPGQREVVTTGEQHGVVPEEGVVADLHVPALGADQHVAQHGVRADLDP